MASFSHLAQAQYQRERDFEELENDCDYGY
jgi:hypothetical protein